MFKHEADDSSDGKNAGKPLIKGSGSNGKTSPVVAGSGGGQKSPGGDIELTDIPPKTKNVTGIKPNHKSKISTATNATASSDDDADSTNGKHALNSRCDS